MQGLSDRLPPIGYFGKGNLSVQANSKQILFSFDSDGSNSTQ